MKKYSSGTELNWKAIKLLSLTTNPPTSEKLHSILVVKFVSSFRWFVRGIVIEGRNILGRVLSANKDPRILLAYPVQGCHRHKEHRCSIEFVDLLFECSLHGDEL
jgi:hypothetical protein